MWSIIPIQFRILIVVVIGVIGASALSALFGFATGETPPAYRMVSLVATAIGAILIPISECLWRPLWRWFPFLGKLVFPDLNGTWTGDISSSWKAKTKDNPLPPIPTTFWIKQGLFQFSVRMNTEESTSGSLHCVLTKDKILRVFRVWYVYHNQPNIAVQTKSARHDGAAWLEVSMDMTSTQVCLNGQYFTQRKTNGEIHLTRKSRKILQIN